MCECEFECEIECVSVYECGSASSSAIANVLASTASASTTMSVYARACVRSHLERRGRAPINSGREALRGRVSPSLGATRNMQISRILTTARPVNGIISGRLTDKERDELRG